MARHVRYRCAPRSELRREFEPMPEVETGAAWFSRQPAAVWRGMVPAALWDAVEAGEVPLDDFVVQTESTRWGPSYRETTIGEARRNATMRGRVAA